MIRTPKGPPPGAGKISRRIVQGGEVMKKRQMLLLAGGAAFLLLLFVLILAPGRGPDGRYVSRDNPLISYIEFGKDRSVRFRLLGMNTANMKYQRKGDTILINVPAKGETLFQIIDAKTIKGVSSGFEGTYVKGTPRAL
jgi:hypothetical protein